MNYLCLFLLTSSLMLLTACGSYSVTETEHVQAAALSTPAQKTKPTATQEKSAGSNLVASTTSVEGASIPSEACPVTRPAEPAFTPPSPFSPSPVTGGFWYGTEALWTALPANGVWADLPHNPEGYTQKVLWWRKGYFWKDEPEPQLSVIGQRLDGPAAPLNVSKATNAFAEDIQSAMLVGVEFPTLGCWEISGNYAGTELSFVVWVAP